MLKLTIILFVGAVVVATVPARAVDLPDYGSKNFNPSSDTPNYFANENAPVSARTADTTQSDWSVVDEMAPAQPAFEGARSAYSHGGRHGRYAVAGRSGREGASRSGGGAYSARVVSWGGAKPGSGGLVTNPRSTAKQIGAKHAKPGARHASTNGARYTVK
jgi:hypothetical protein